MEQKYIIASDTRDILGTWTESNIIEIQSLPEHGNGARGIVVQGVGVKQRATKKGHGTALTEHQQQNNYTGQSQHSSSASTEGGTVVVTTSSPCSVEDGATQVIVSHHHQSTSEGNTSSAEAAMMINTLRPAKTKLGKARIRMKWTNEVNEYILRTYYMITNLETNCKHYRDTLHRLFNEEFPDVDVCAQRIADQRRAIVKNQLLPHERIDEIRREVEVALQQQEAGEGQVTVSESSSGGGRVSLSSVTPLIMTSPMMVSKAADPTMTVWYGCVKEDGYPTGPTGHKLRKLNHDEESSTGGGGGQQQQQQQGQPQQQQHIIIHTTSALGGGPGPHTIMTTTDALRR